MEQMGEGWAMSSTPITVTDPLILVLAPGATPSAVGTARGRLFESFVARLLYAYGYSQPTTERLNETANGIELDVVASHEMTNQAAVAECKAYTSHIPASMVAIFHSKLVTRRSSTADDSIQGFFVAIPRLTADGHEYAREITAHDRRFQVLTARTIADKLLERRWIADCPAHGTPTSDTAVVITEEGVHAACLELDPVSRKPARVLVWAVQGLVPAPVIGAVAAADYAQGCPVVDARADLSHPLEQLVAAPDPTPMIVPVVGSKSDFEYQLPAAPKFFVGRKRVVEDLRRALDSHTGVLVLNAKSGWGKSSVALRLESLAKERKGYALVTDTRTATHRRFVTDALSVAAQRAQDAKVLTLPANASWASLSSALQTLQAAIWHAGPLVVFFDQFENIFRDADLTREFRDLALGIRELAAHVLIGFAWKTDIVAWTENYPYQMRDQIRDNATRIELGPLGPGEVGVLLQRLEKELDAPLARDLRSRLREYSQGLPWLFKKLAGHLLREVQAGATQEDLANEALNVQNLFDSDLAELSPAEHEAVRYIARYAPMAVSEVTERVTPAIVESLIHSRRLIVQVGERLDTYWDIFRDYLNTGRIPVEDSYILRMSPVSVARLLNHVVSDDGDSRVPDLAKRMRTSETVVFNLSRELRLLGTITYEPNRVRVIPDIWNAEDREIELRRRVATALRRHRAFSAFLGLADRGAGTSMSTFARELPTAFPAVEVRDSTWISYARVFLQWFEYAGLVVQEGSTWSAAPDGTIGTPDLLGGYRRRLRGGFPHDAPGPSLRLLLRVAAGQTSVPETDRRAVTQLLAIGALTTTPAGTYRVHDGLVADGAVVPAVLQAIIRTVPGVTAGLDMLDNDPAARAEDIGQAVKAAVRADWTEGTATSIGKHLRAWAREAGIPVRAPDTALARSQDGLF